MFGVSCELASVMEFGFKQVRRDVAEIRPTVVVVIDDDFTVVHDRLLFALK